MSRLSILSKQFYKLHLIASDCNFFSLKVKMEFTLRLEGRVLLVTFWLLLTSTQVDIRLPGLLCPWRQRYTGSITLNMMDAFISEGVKWPITILNVVCG